ncbi:MAG: carbohydrate ABC transporter permease, partial [Microbacteriaceae bacterium]|nr:carbohydrate ABC transporter permease [Microbacteriaceae bacterium]
MAIDARLGGDIRPTLRAKRNRERLSKTVVYVLLSVLLLVVLLPFLWMLSSSFKNNVDVLSVPIHWIPQHWVWSNYRDIWKQVPLAGYLGNSALLAVSITFLQVLTGSFAAYGFSKVKFPGRDGLFLAYLATIAVPWQAYMIPQYVMMQHAHLTNTFWAL